jgi:regulator of protease activity HflC (stomatin/prohibitin superfamily)
MTLIPKGQEEKDYRILFQTLSVNDVRTVTNDNVGLGFETSLHFRPHTDDMTAAKAQKVRSAIDNIVGRISLHDFLAKPDLLRNEFHHAANTIAMEMGLEISDFKVEEVQLPLTISVHPSLISSPLLEHAPIL